MPPLKRLAGFFARLLLLYGVFIVAWPVVRPGYVMFFRAGGNFLLGSFGSMGQVRFKPNPGDDPDYDTQVVLTNLANRARRTTESDSRFLGYMPVAALVALILATPITWRRRGLALLWGLPLVHGFVVLRVALLLL